MALIATVTPGKTFVGSELVTNSKLNQSAAPTVDITGTADTADITADAVTAAKLAFGATYYCAASTSSNVITLTASGHTLADATLAAGLLVVFKADATNTSTVDLKLSSAGTAKNLYKDASQELAAGDIRSGQMCVAEYDGTQWQLVSNLGNGAWDRYVETGGADGLAYTATFGPTVTTLTSGTRVAVKWNITNAGVVTFAPDGLTAKAVRKGADAALVAGDLVDNQISELVYDSTANSAAGAWLLTGPVTASTRTTVPVRQTVLSCSVASTGLPNYMTGVASTAISFQNCDTTNLVIAFAAGFDTAGTVDYVAVVSTNTSSVWSSLSTNGTYYLWVDRNTSTGALTYGKTATTLRPTYVSGGSAATTPDTQHTFLINSMTMWVGNGTTASTVQRVFLGEVVVAANVISSITPYMPRGEYVSVETAFPQATAVNATVTLTHQIGLKPAQVRWVIRNTTTQHNYTEGDELEAFSTYGGANVASYGWLVPVTSVTSLACVLPWATIGSVAQVLNKTTYASAAVITTTSWRLVAYAWRGW
jgi:hypothetical protein